MVDVAFHCHPERTGKCLEYAFYLVVLIGAFGFDVQVHPGGIAQTLEKMQEHLRGNITNALTLKTYIPHQPRTATKVESSMGRQ